MKKTFLLAGLSMALLSCTSQQNTVVKQDSTHHTAENSLDIAGIYEGDLPCADCEAIKIQITLNSNKTYLLQSTYVGTSTVQKHEGTFSVNGNIVTLSGIKEAPTQYFVGENYLKQLDMKGNEIKGSLAAKYILRKVK